MKVELTEAELRGCLAAVMYQRQCYEDFDMVKDSIVADEWRDLENKLQNYLDKS